MTLVQQAGVSFVDVAILRFLLLAFMKAFQDRRAARQDCQKAGAPAESALSSALSKPDTFPFGALSSMMSSLVPTARACARFLCFGDLARELAATLPLNAESTTALRKLLQASLCAAR
jgi:hypothetical protein